MKSIMEPRCDMQHRKHENFLEEGADLEVVLLARFLGPWTLHNLKDPQDLFVVCKLCKYAIPKSPATASLQDISRRMHQVLLARMSTSGSQTGVSILTLCVNGIHKLLQANVPFQGEVKLGHSLHDWLGVVIQASNFRHEVKNLLSLPVGKSGSIYSFNRQEHACVGNHWWRILNKLVKTNRDFGNEPCHLGNQISR